MSIEQQFLIDCIIDDVASYLIDDMGITILESLDIIYNSQFYDKLSDVSTCLYRQSSRYNYEYLKHELNFGKIA